MQKKTVNNVLQYLFIAINAVLMAFACYIFVVPNNFAPSGINGIAVMIQYKFHISIGYLNLLANIPICLAAFFMGLKKFAIRSYTYCVFYSVSYLIIQRIDPARLQYVTNGIDTVLPALIAGCITGISTALLFKIDSSQCGTDVIAKAFSDKLPELNFFWINFFLNAGIAVVSVFVYADPAQGSIDYKPVALCILYSITSSILANLINVGEKEASQIVVITAHPDEVYREICKFTHHSCTKLQGTGMYSGTDKTVLIFIVNKYQTPYIVRTLRKFPETFSYVGTVNETVGFFDSRRVREKKE